jgi:hypothetical protein
MLKRKRKEKKKRRRSEKSVLMAAEARLEEDCQAVFIPI